MKVDLARKARPERATISYYWFENPYAGIERTRFHRIRVPFEPFDTGCEGMRQPEQVSLVVDWLDLPIEEPGDLDCIVITKAWPKSTEATIYLGGEHSWVWISALSIRATPDGFALDMECMVDFEGDAVAESEDFAFTASADYVGELPH